MNWVLAYLAAYLGAGLLLDRLARRALAGCASLPPARRCPPVTLIKPVCGADEFTERNFRSWLAQDYPAPVQFIFALQDARDPALPILAGLKAEGFPHFETVVAPVRAGFSGKMSNLASALGLARHQVLVFSDADIFAPPGALRRLVGTLERGADIASCPVLHGEAAGLWGRVFAEAWNAIILWVWVPAMAAGRSPGVAGGTLALERRILEGLGGLEAFRDCLQEDVALGAAAKEKGLTLALGPVLSSPVGRFTWRELRDKLRRVSFFYIHKSPGGRPAALAIPLALYGHWLVLAAGLLRLDWRWAAAWAAFVLGRACLSGLLAARAGGRFRPSFDFLAGDWAGVNAFVGALAVPEVYWGGIRYRVKKGGRVTRVG